MEGFGGSGFRGTAAVTKKRRSVTIRRPRPDSQLVLESSPSSAPSSDNASKVSLDENASYDAGSRRKEFSLNSSSTKVASLSKIEGASTSKRIKKDDRKFGDVDGFYGGGGSRSGMPKAAEQGWSGSDMKRCSEGVLAPANWKSSSKVKESFERSPDGYGRKNGDGNNLAQSVGASNGSAENKLRKVKLKVGGVTRTIHANSNSETGSVGSSAAKSSRSSDPYRHRQKLILQDNSDDDQSLQDKGNDSQGAAWKDLGGGSISRGVRDDSRGKAKEGSLLMKQTESDDAAPSSEPVRKSKRVPKRRVLDGAVDEDAEDDEIRYLERLKTTKAATDYVAEFEDEGDAGAKKRKLSKVSKGRRTSYEVDDDFNVSRSLKDNRKKLRTGRESEDTDYIEEEEPGSDDGSESKKKKQKKELIDTLQDTRAEPLTTRQRALQSGKGTGNDAPFIEFPNGLPPAPPRKQKEKLSEVEQQAKKAEAAQRRRLQVEKQNREIQAAAISKILGHDSKKKKSKEQEEKAQEKAADDLTLASNTVRWVMGPTGTVVTFADDVGLPSIFDSKPCSYPPPREKCAGPSCPNTYKYRDSKSNLPLCSLQCYKAVHESTQSLKTC